MMDRKQGVKVIEDVGKVIKVGVNGAGKKGGSESDRERWKGIDRKRGVKVLEKGGKGTKVE